jgi:hypothetical protein
MEEDRRFFKKMLTGRSIGKRDKLTGRASYRVNPKEILHVTVRGIGLFRIG